MVWKPLGDVPTPPQRPKKDEYGTLGRKISLTTNFFEVTVAKKDLKIYHYDVVIKDHRGEEKLPKKKKMIVFEEMKKSFPQVFAKPVGYDSMKNAYCTSQLKVSKSKTYNVSVKFEPSARNSSNFTVAMEKVNEASLSELFQSMKFIQGQKKETPTTVMQMIEVLFRHSRAMKYEQVGGRSFYSLLGEFARPSDIGGGKELTTGFFGSLRPAVWKDGSVLLNLDMAHTAFYKPQPVLNFLKETCNMSDRDFENLLEFRKMKAVEKCLKGLRLRVTYAQRTYKFLSVAREGADKKKLTNDDNKGDNKGNNNTTVQQYMKNRYDLTLRFPRLNCIKVGNPEKDVNLPLELCTIDKGQRVVKKLSEDETSNVIKSTAVLPHMRLDQINRVAAANKFNNDPMLKALTFTVSDRPLKTMGRVLPAPGITMVNKSFQPFQGVWDIRDKTFHNAATLNDNWAIINYDPRTKPTEFIKMLVSMGKQKGMKIDPPFDIYDWKGRGEPLPLEDFEYYKKQRPNIQLIMCILPGKRFYGAIKKAGDTEVEIITQCVLGKNVYKCQAQTVGNILLKINAKMGGVNNIVTVSPNSRTGLVVSFAEPFLVMGADVNHPPAGGDSGIPSLAAVVGSYDPHATKYAVERRVQESRVEMITDLEIITKNLLRNFYKNSRTKPTRIIMYRDGVSESQFQTVLSYEMKAMRRACESMPGGNYRPGITFICVQKRHHTRLFCDDKDGVGKSRNVPPGTIVDKDITHPTETDFYLCSHQGIQGTSKPTHYHLLWDDNDLPIDELQMLTYRLCHVYSRCSRAVSIPTPVYYAHLAAFRAKVYVQELLGNGSDSGSVASGQSGKTCTTEELRRIADVSIDKVFSSRLHYI